MDKKLLALARALTKLGISSSRFRMDTESKKELDEYLKSLKGVVCITSCNWPESLRSSYCRVTLYGVELIID